MKTYKNLSREEARSAALMFCEDDEKSMLSRFYRFGYEAQLHNLYIDETNRAIKNANEWGQKRLRRLLDYFYYMKDNHIEDNLQYTYVKEVYNPEFHYEVCSESDINDANIVCRLYNNNIVARFRFGVRTLEGLGGTVNSKFIY